MSWPRGAKVAASVEDGRRMKERGVAEGGQRSTLFSRLDVLSLAARDLVEIGAHSLVCFPHLLLASKHTMYYISISIPCYNSNVY